MSLRRLALWSIFSVSAVALAAAGAACVGDDPAVVTPSGNEDDASSTSDAPGGDDSGTCAVGCADPSTLARCDGTTETCRFGCNEMGGAHCAVIHPSGLVLPEDLATTGVGAVSIAANTRFVTDTGVIDGVRGANVDPLKMEVIDGIGFRLAIDGPHRVGIWTFESLEIPEGVTIRFTETNPVALVAQKTIAIVGVVDARGYDLAGTLCADAVAGPGGFRGGVMAPGLGPGGGLVPSTDAAGRSGAGHGGVGGAGGPVGANPGADGGVAYGTPTLIPLVGGSGGAGSSQLTGPGGGGGGAIQIVAGEKISIGGGATTGGINAGGCHGKSTVFNAPGGAGGSGGSILVETPLLELLPNGAIAANGGGGGADGTTNGEPGPLTPGPADGAPGAPPTHGFGGVGSGGTMAETGDGRGGASGNTTGGSGGGASGRIRINNRSGTFTPPPSTVISPRLGIATNPPSTVGMLDIR